MRTQAELDEEQFQRDLAAALEQSRAESLVSNALVEAMDVDTNDKKRKATQEVENIPAAKRIAPLDLGSHPLPASRIDSSSPRGAARTLTAASPLHSARSPKTASQAALAETPPTSDSEEFSSSSTRDFGASRDVSFDGDTNGFRIRGVTPNERKQAREQEFERRWSELSAKALSDRKTDQADYDRIMSTFLDQWQSEEDHDLAIQLEEDEEALDASVEAPPPEIPAPTIVVKPEEAPIAEKTVIQNQVVQPSPTPPKAAPIAQETINKNPYKTPDTSSDGETTLSPQSTQFESDFTQLQQTVRSVPKSNHFGIEQFIEKMDALVAANKQKKSPEKPAKKIDLPPAVSASNMMDITVERAVEAVEEATRVALKQSLADAQKEKENDEIFEQQIQAALAESLTVESSSSNVNLGSQPMDMDITGSLIEEEAEQISHPQSMLLPPRPTSSSGLSTSQKIYNASNTTTAAQNNTTSQQRQPGLFPQRAHLASSAQKPTEDEDELELRSLLAQNVAPPAVTQGSNVGAKKSAPKSTLNSSLYIDLNDGNADDDEEEGHGRHPSLSRSSSANRAQPSSLVVSVPSPTSPLVLPSNRTDAVESRARVPTKPEAKAVAPVQNVSPAAPSAIAHAGQQEQEPSGSTTIRSRWTEEEDNKMIDMIEGQAKSGRTFISWQPIYAAFPGRTQTAIKMHWTILKTKHSLEPFLANKAAQKELAASAHETDRHAEPSLEEVAHEGEHAIGGDAEAPGSPKKGRKPTLGIVAVDKADYKRQYYHLKHAAKKSTSHIQNTASAISEAHEGHFPSASVAPPSALPLAPAPTDQVHTPQQTNSQQLPQQSTTPEATRLASSSLPPTSAPLAATAPAVAPAVVAPISESLYQPKATPTLDAIFGDEWDIF